MAKTVMGSYSANEQLAELRNQYGGGANRAAPAPHAPAPPAPHAPAPPAHAPYQAPRPAPMPAGPSPGMGPNQAAPYQQPPSAPVAPSAAPTMFAPGAGAPPQGNFGGAATAAATARTVAAAPSPFSPPAGGPYHAGPAGAGPGPSPFSPPAPQPMPMPYAPQPAPAPAPMPMPQPMPMPMGSPYLAAQTSARGGRPIEPWRDSLRLMMFVWGGLLLLAFAAPVTVEPLQFNWDAILEGEGKAKLPPLIMAAVGLLSIVLALIPTSPAPRGLLAAVLGLAGILIPIFLAGVPHWKLLLALGGMLVLIPALLLREEYRDSILPRLLVTIGALAVLSQYVIPANDTIPIVSIIEGALEAPLVEHKVMALMMIAYVLVLVLTLLAWLPSPASGGAKVFAWILLLWPAALLLATLAFFGAIGEIAAQSPYTMVSWIAGIGGVAAASSGDGGGIGAGAGASVALGVSYAVLVGYGLATVIGKKLE